MGSQTVTQSERINTAHCAVLSRRAGYGGVREAVGVVGVVLQVHALGCDELDRVPRDEDDVTRTAASAVSLWHAHG